MKAVLLLLLAVHASSAAPQEVDQHYARPVHHPDPQDDTATPADVQYMLDDGVGGLPDGLGGDLGDDVVEAGGEHPWETLHKDTVNISLDDVDWSLDQLPPSIRRALRLVLFDNFKANFT